MSLVTGEGVGKNFGAGYIFQELSFCLEDDDRVGLVGPNGQGKTTLLRILAGLEDSTKGTVQRRRLLRIGYLPQDAPVLPGVTLWQYMLDAFADIRRMEQELHSLAEALSARPDEQALLDRYGALQHQFEARGGYGYHTRIEAVLSGLLFTPRQHHQLLTELSGGQRSRAMLAGLLLTDPELLLLDEPTNHLDLDAIDWLEEYLRSFRGAIIAVSHDRYFLDNVAGRIWEMSFGKLEAYRGNYSAYTRQRAERLLERQRRYQGQQEFIQRTEEFIRRNVGAKRVNVAQGRKTRLERFVKQEAIERPPEQEAIHLRFKDIPRSGDAVFRSVGAACGYGGRALVDLPDVLVGRGERVAVLGGNGVGKTTLLRTLLGELPPVTGQVRQGANVRIGYLPQTHEALDPLQTAVQVVIDADPDLTAEQARGLLGGLLLSGDDALRNIEFLSGGQRSRVVLARLAAQKANVLLLDEPTNHLDLPSQEVLQQVLVEFPGTVIFVSHDRYLVRALAQRIWSIEDGGVRDLVGGWEEFLRLRRQRAARQVQAQRKDASAGRQAHRQARRQTNQVLGLRRRQQELEAKLQQAEARITDVGHRISQAGQEGLVADVRTFGLEYQRLEIQLKDMWDEWTGCTEQLEKLEREEQAEGGGQ